MYIKDRVFKLINNIYIIITFILGILLAYAIINTIVSLKYEHEKEMLCYNNLASNYIRQSLNVMYVFGTYLLFNFVYLIVIGHGKKSGGDSDPLREKST